ncbi:MAG TPA: hypothetical protein VI895_14330 [Bdellovibrionota bacterium]|nr:hypothetical protein [Bdellovibrionota bacterium]
MSSARAEEAVSERPSPARISIQNSLQAGLEYDTNVFRVFGTGDDDFLTRILFKSDGAIRLNDETRIGWSYQGGGKKFVDRSEQDLFIQLVEFPFTYRPNAYFSFLLTPDFKYQNEDNSLDPAGVDINEDSLSTLDRVSFRFSLPRAFVIEPFGDFNYYDFRAIETYSFYRERGGIGIKKSFGSSWSLGSDYLYSAQQFSASPREDKENDVSAYGQYSSSLFFSLRYSYQDSNSSDEQFSFTNHRVSLLFSVPLWERDLPESALDAGESPALFVFHVLGTLQFKKFPSVFAFTEEGQRFLQTGQDDENFNSLIVKLTYHPLPWLAIETKYTRYSNAISSQEENFGRSLYYGGLRGTF